MGNSTFHERGLTDGDLEVIVNIVLSATVDVISILVFVSEALNLSQSVLVFLI